MKNCYLSCTNSFFEYTVLIRTADYYPFGMLMPERSKDHVANAYRYGYNGMEMDNEVKGNGNSYTTEFRQYDPRLGRWLSLDPLMHQFPWMSPYVAFDNNPVFFIDPYGLASTNEGDPPPTNSKGSVIGTNDNPVELDGFVLTPDKGNSIINKEQLVHEKEYGSYDNFNVGTDHLSRQNYAVPEPLPEPSEEAKQAALIAEFQKKKAYVGRKTHPQTEHAIQTGIIYDKAFGILVPGRDLLKDVINGKTVTATAVIIGGVEFVPFGKLFVRGGKLFVKLMKGGTEVVEDVTEATIKVACFVEGTPVAVAEGVAAIENIKVGDKVWAFDEETGVIELKTVYNTVVKEIDHLDKLIAGNDTIYTTDNHPFWVSDTWKKAQNLQIGDTLTLRNGEYRILTYKERIDTTVTVYNFAVEDFHTYFVGEQQILVHNDNPCATAVTKKTATEIAKNCKKMTENQITQLLGKDWHKNGTKSKLVKKFSKELKGSTNADFYIDKVTNEVFLQGNKTKAWVQTGLFLE